MTTTPAMPELSRGEIIGLISPQSKNSADHDIEFAYRVLAALSSQPSPEQAGVSDEAIRGLGQRNAWHYKYSSDPAHSSTYKFNDACLLQFARAVLTQRPAAQTEREAFEGWARPNGYDLRRNDVLGHYSSIDTSRAWSGFRAGRASLPAPQQATPEPVGEVVYIAKGHLREVLNGNTMNAYLSPEPDRFADVALFTRPAPGVPGDSELLDYLDTLATRAAGSDLHCFGGRVALYVRTGIGSQIEASGAGTAREAIRAALAAAQAKGAGQ